MLKVNTVLQATVNNRPLRLGNTYHVDKVDISTFTIRYFDGCLPYRTKTYSISELSLYFKVIDDRLCPTCLKQPKAPHIGECLRCYGV
jgi:hypothetical protein